MLFLGDGLRGQEVCERLLEEIAQMRSPNLLMRSELERKIEMALAELPENQRTAILLCRGDELSYEEIAEVLGCSLSATKSLTAAQIQLTDRGSADPEFAHTHWR